MLLGLYFFIVIALPLALGSYVVFNGLPRSRQCPRCTEDTVRLQSSAHALASRLLPADDVSLRWCITCGWQGTARLARPHRARVRSAPARTGSRGDRVDLRSLSLDGDAWRVMVECWATEGRWKARLVFVAPGGQVWHDEHSMEGDSVLEVISRAFSLPEQTLAGRLRRAIR